MLAVKLNHSAEVGRGLLLMLCLMAGSAWAAWEWQANAGSAGAEQKAAHQATERRCQRANSVLILARTEQTLRPGAMAGSQ